MSNRARRGIDFDVLIVGSSVAGSSTAARLAGLGWCVLLLDKAVFPREKLCGEGLMPGGVRILRESGLLEPLDKAGARRFFGVRFLLPGPRRLELDFRELASDVFGLVCSRRELDHILLQHALHQESVEFLPATRAESVRWLDDRVEVEVAGPNGRRRVRTRVVIAADGIHSAFHRRLGIGRSVPRRRRMAVRARFESCRAVAAAVEIHCRPGSEAYVAPLSDDSLRVTCLLSHPVGSGPFHLESIYQSALEGFPALSEQLEGATRVGAVEATAPVSLRLNRCHGARCLLVGDAAGACDPITGQGMSLALRDAKLACEILDEKLRANDLSDSALGCFTKRRQAYFQPSSLMAGRLLAILRSRFLMRRTVRALQKRDSLRHKMLGMVSGSATTTSLTWLDQLHLATGI